MIDKSYGFSYDDNKGGDTMGMMQKIKTAAAYKNMTQAEIAKSIGMSPQNFSKKMMRESFTDEELRKIADALGCAFVPFSFAFDDGMKI